MNEQEQLQLAELWPQQQRRAAATTTKDYRQLLQEALGAHLRRGNMKNAEFIELDFPQLGQVDLHRVTERHMCEREVKLGARGMCPCDHFV